MTTPRIAWKLASRLRTSSNQSQAGVGSPSHGLANLNVSRTNETGTPDLEFRRRIKSGEYKIGHVISTKMPKSVTILCTHTVWFREKNLNQPLRRRSKILANDEDEVCNMGDKVPDLASSYPTGYFLNGL